MKSSTIPLLSILGSLLTTAYIAAQPLKARQSQVCTNLNQFVQSLSKDENVTLPEVEELEADDDDIMEEIGCPDEELADLCTAAQELEDAISASDFAFALSVAEELESDAGC